MRQTTAARNSRGEKIVKDIPRATGLISNALIGAAGSLITRKRIMTKPKSHALGPKC